MSLSQTLPYPEYNKALKFTKEQCEKIALLANLNISFEDTTKPGELLLKMLERRGCTAQRFQQFASVLYSKTVSVYYKPAAKIAILIANDRYIHLSKLATPSVDCDSLAAKLKKLDFIVFIIKNAPSTVLKDILVRILDSVPEDSYCFIFYAGHGCQICNTKCMLGIDCPVEDIQMQHCVTENYVLKEVQRCKLDLCIFIMDMCRIYLDRNTNPQIYTQMASVEEYAVHKNLLISYSAQSSESAYEMLQMECSTSIDNYVTYELKAGDTDKIVPGASLYVNALCGRLEDDLPVSAMLDVVHRDVENSIKKQRPIKVQCGTDRRSLYDVVSGDINNLNEKFKVVTEDFGQYCIFC